MKELKKALAVLLCTAMIFQIPAPGPSAQAADAGAAQTQRVTDSVPDMTKPVITITPANEHYKGSMYCEAPTISVHDDGGNLISVVASSGSNSVTGEIIDGTDCTISIEEKEEASWTVEAIDDAGNQAKQNFYVGHQPMGRQIVTIEPTCTENGINVAYSNCANCGERFIFYTYGGAKALGHQPDMDNPQVIIPCSEHPEEVTVYKCTRCDALVTAEGALYETQEGEGHIWVAKKDKASCDVPGTSYEECSRCKLRRNVETIPVTGHSFTDWVITTPADCSTGTVGEKERVCTKCEKKETQPIPASHTWSDRVELKAASCTEAGYTGFKCTVCNTENPENHIEIPALGHSYADDGDCTTESVCSRDGCGQKLPAKQHAWGEYESDRSGHWQKCTNEGCQKTTKDEGGKAEPHVNELGDYECTSSYNCSVCGYKVEGYRSHSVTSGWVSEGAYHWLACTHEGCTYRQNVSGHDGRDDGNCTTAWVCKTCKATLQPAMQHKWSEEYTSMVNVHRKRCTNPGCNQVTAVEEHTFITDTGDCTKGVVCSKCGYVAIHGESGHRFTNSAYHGDETGHWRICTNKNCTVTSAVSEHSGGVATCRDRAVCDICRTPYGELNPQNHVGETEMTGMKEATEEEEGYTGDEICTSCKGIVKQGSTIPKLEKPCVHEWQTKYDDVKSWEQCTLCDAVQNERPHTFTRWFNDDTEHWQQCEYCEHTTNHSAHVMDTDAVDKNCTTPIACKDCGYIMVAAMEHAFGESWAFDEDGHWHVCTNADCEQTGEEIPHVTHDDGNCTTPLKCEDCGHTVTDAYADHEWSTVWKSDATGHYHECVNPGCTQRQYADHVAAPSDGLCTTPVLCEVCEWVMEEAAANHDFGDNSDYHYDASGHWLECQTPGCTGHSNVDAHSGGKATCAHEAVCDVCQQSYGSKDPLNHDGGVELKGYMEPTVEKEGYSGDTYCIGCGEIIESGNIIDKLIPEHVHVFDYNKEHGIYESDDVNHWLACPCGETAEKAEHVYGELKKDNTHHWDECDVCGRIWREDHIYENGSCKVCGAEQPKHEHNFKWNYTDATHWQECSDCGDRINTASHGGGTATCISKAVCTDCGQEYGQTDPDNHTGETELRRQKEATEGEEGYTGDLYCLDCGNMIKEGTVIPPLPTQAPTEAPTQEPTEEPTATPTDEPTEAPTVPPTDEPTATPTDEPTEVPTVPPTDEPTVTPTQEPTATPTDEPTQEPTATPTEEPTATPTQEPTATPTQEPTTPPTEEPTATPTDEPTQEPTATPTQKPTQPQTQAPSQPQPQPQAAAAGDEAQVAQVSAGTVETSKDATIKSTKHSIKISWKPDKDATAGYRVYLKSGKKYKKIADVKSGKTSLKIKKIGKKRLKAGTTYKVKIVSLKKESGKVKKGRKWTYTTATKPMTPKCFSAKRHKGTKAVLTWKKVAGADGYEIRMSTKEKGGYKTIKKTDADNVVVKAVKNKKCYFRIRAYKKVTNGYVYGKWIEGKL